MIFRKRLVPLLNVFLLSLLLGTTVARGSQISLSNQSATPGTTILTQVAISSQGASISGVQFDLEYDNSAMALAATLGTQAKTAGKSIYTVDLAPNTKRILIIGLNQTSIPDGTLLSISVTVNSTAASGTYELALSNVCGTDPSGNSASISGTGSNVTVNASTSARLQSNGVLNAGSFLSGAVAPGELVTLMGSGIGPASAQLPTGSPSNTVLAGTSVLFDGIAAPLLYASPNQINAIVPFGVAGKSTTQLTVTAQGQTIAAVAEPISTSAPSIFSIDSSGTGAGAILNQDLSVNSPSNPAAKGSIIAIYATGGGQMTPASVDGQVTGTVLPRLTLPVSVQIGGLDANVSYAGAAPGLIAGVIQVNALIPSGVTSGSAIPIVLTIGGINSQSGVTVAIR